MDTKDYEAEFPNIFYGTAWKEETTGSLVYDALVSGFRAIDTANQRKHYFEEGVGQGLELFYQDSNLNRNDIFLQTKFTYLRGQDDRLPYDESASFTDQVEQSFASSLEHLKTNYLDSYLLHGPFSAEGLTNEDFETWSAIENLYDEELVHNIGVSNFSAAQLSELCLSAKVKPQFVQNRCFAKLQWDQEVRSICQQEDIIYQGFSLLTANTEEFKNIHIVNLIEKYSRPLPEIIFRFANQIGILPLTGTTQKKHMVSDLTFMDFELTDKELYQLVNLVHM